MDSNDLSITTKVRLNSQKTWPTWYAQLRYLARARGVWDRINPDTVPPEAPPLPDLPESEDEEELPANATAAQVARAQARSQVHAQALRSYQIKYSIHENYEAKIQSISNWVYTTVDPVRLELAILRAKDDTSLYALIKQLKKDLCPSDDHRKEQVRQAYREILKKAPRVEPQRWILDWTREHANAVLLDLDEIKGTLAIKDFLIAVSSYNATWAQHQIDQLAHPGAKTIDRLTLEEYAQWFSQVIQQKEFDHKSVYATLGAKQDCPCRSSPDHTWYPVECARLQHALTGKSDRELRTPPSKADAEQIRKRLDQDKYKDLRVKLEEKEWISGGKGNAGFPGKIAA